MEIFNNILGSIREPLMVLDADLKVVKANHSFYQTFSVTPDETEGALIYDLGNRQWDIPKLRELLEDILPDNTVMNDLEMEYDFETIGPKIMHLNAHLDLSSYGKPIHFLAGAYVAKNRLDDTDPRNVSMSRFNVLFLASIGDQPLGQGTKFTLGEHPADHIAAEDVHDHIQVAFLISQIRWDRKQCATSLIMTLFSNQIWCHFGFPGFKRFLNP